MKFYSVATRSHVTVPDSKCTKGVMKLKNGERFIVKATDPKGHKLQLFVSKETYDKLKIKQA